MSKGTEEDRVHIKRGEKEGSVCEVLSGSHAQERVCLMRGNL